MLLGEAWKSLPLEERESYSTKAKVLADEQKKIYPDCWKRKKTVANSSSSSSSTSNLNNHGDQKTQPPPLLHHPLPLPPLEVAAQRMDSLDTLIRLKTETTDIA